MKLKLDKNFIPMVTSEGNEIYQNGIFEWNISKIIDYIKENPYLLKPALISVKEYYRPNPNRYMDYVMTTDTSKPIILAEINPGNYNVIDGNHRLCKAYNGGFECIMAYKIMVKEHLPFLVTLKVYQAFVNYWNGKVDDRNPKPKRRRQTELSDRTTSIKSKPQQSI